MAWRLRSLLFSLAAVAAVLGIAGSASAADPAAVTITSCKNDALTLAGKVALRGKDARKARGAVLQMQFRALPLFGLPKSGALKTVGKKLRASGQEVFTGLPADNWVGVLSWRYKKRSRTVLSGDARSQPQRIGRSKGIANCTLSEGLKPVDATAPQVSILPSDDLWHRGPAPVQVSATDDFSGVKTVRYSLDGGPMTQIANRGSFEIPAEGAHTVAADATDVAGNTGTASATVRVDSSAPTKPAVQSPASVTANRAPTIRWTPSTDSGSGMRGYVVSIQRADGSVVATLNTDANTVAVTAPTLDDNQNYTATVTAVDNTTGQPWATNSDPYAFRVDSTANVDSVTPPSGTIFSGGSKKPTFTLTLDRAADPATVSGAVKLHSVDSNSDPATTVGCATTPCTKISVAAQSNLPEGRYQLTVSGLKSGNGENTTFQNFTAVYSVAFLEDASGVDISGLCVGSTMSASTTAAPLTSPGGETARVEFDWTAASGASWSAQGMSDGSPIGNPIVRGPGSGHETFTFPLPSMTHSITVKFTTSCSGGNANALDTNNIVGARVP